MIETVMLIALGFLGASLLALMIAPAIWRRAVRLTRREMVATMPMSPADIEADKDLLRAEYATRVRQLELALEDARERAARYRVERDKNAVTIGQMEADIASLKAALSERANASTVLEQTIKRSIPDLEAQLERARQIIAARDRELAERARAFENQTEAVTLAKQLAERRAEEIERLREALRNGAPAGGWLRRSRDRDEEMEDLARENGRLEADLSKAREEIARWKERESANADQLRAEMHRLADLMMSIGQEEKKAEAGVKEPEAKQAGDAAPAQGDPSVTEETRAKPARKRRKRTTAKSKAAKTATSGRAGKAGQPRKSLRERLARLQQKENA